MHRNIVCSNSRSVDRLRKQLAIEFARNFATKEKLNEKPRRLKMFKNKEWLEDERRRGLSLMLKWEPRLRDGSYGYSRKGKGRVIG